MQTHKSVGSNYSSVVEVRACALPLHRNNGRDYLSMYKLQLIYVGICKRPQELTNSLKPPPLRQRQPKRKQQDSQHFNLCVIFNTLQRWAARRVKSFVCSAVCSALKQNKTSTLHITWPFCRCVPLQKASNMEAFPFHYLTKRYMPGFHRHQREATFYEWEFSILDIRHDNLNQTWQANSSYAKYTLMERAFINPLSRTALTLNIY